jgi:hypothetical protein
VRRFRDSETEKIINPMLFFGFDKEVRTLKKPVCCLYVFYPVDSKTSVNLNALLLNLSLQKTVAISLIKWCRMVK